MPTPPPPPHIDPDQVLPFPAIEVFLNDGVPRIEISGTRHLLEPRELDKVRDEARQQIARTAQILGRPVRVTAHEPTGTWTLVIHPDGTVQDGTERGTERPARGRLGWRRRQR